jgi:uncharacterized membrane protein YgdD (TMEM256/DUF423 family)
LNAKTWLVLGASLGALAVFAGAFGDHYLPRYHELIGADSGLRAKGKLWWETAARYNMYHALALLAVAWIVNQRKSWLANGAGLAMFLGTLVFSGCLYTMGMTGMKMLGGVVPFGGLLLMAGWVLLALAGGSLVVRENSGKTLSKREQDSLTGSPKEPPPEASAPPQEPAAETAG